MKMNHLVKLTVVAAALAGGSTSAAADGDSWVGKKIMTKKVGIKISQTDDQDRQLDLATLNSFLYTVLKEQGPWIMVRQHGVEGWFLKENAVLLEDAPAYFTQQIRINPKDDHAWQCRGYAWGQKR